MAKNVFETNRKKLFERMDDNSAAVIFAGEAPYKRGDEKYPFSPDRNFYYVTGIARENMILLMKKTDGTEDAELYIPRDNGIMAKWIGANMTPEEATEVSGIADISFVDAFETDFADFLFRNNIKHVYLDMENRDWNADFYPALKFAGTLQRKYPAMTLTDLYPILATFVSSRMNGSWNA